MDYREDQDIRINNVQSRGIILKDDKVLMIYRKKNSEKFYTFPGGHMRVGEKPSDTAEREIFEETTIKVKDLDIAFEIKNHIHPKKTKEEYYYVGEWESGEPSLSGEESRRSSTENYYEPMWVSRVEIPSLTVYSLAAKEWFIDSLDKFLIKRG